MTYIFSLLIVAAFGAGWIFGEKFGRKDGERHGYENGSAETRRQLFVAHAADVKGIQQAHATEMDKKDAAHAAEITQLRRDFERDRLSGRGRRDKAR